MLSPSFSSLPPSLQECLHHTIFAVDTNELTHALRSLQAGQQKGPPLPPHTYITTTITYLNPHLFHTHAPFSSALSQFRKSKPPHILACVILSLVFSLFDTLAVASQYSDLPCSNSEGNACSNCAGGDSPLCFVNRISIHLLQSMFFSLTFMMLNLYLTLVRDWRSQQASETTKLPALVCSTTIPFVCACLVCPSSPTPSLAP